MLKYNVIWGPLGIFLIPNTWCIACVIVNSKYSFMACVCFNWVSFENYSYLQCYSGFCYTRLTKTYTAYAEKIACSPTASKVFELCKSNVFPFITLLCIVFTQAEILLSHFYIVGPQDETKHSALTSFCKNTILGLIYWNEFSMLPPGQISWYMAHKSCTS